MNIKSLLYVSCLCVLISPIGQVCCSQTTEKSVRVQVLYPDENIQLDSVIDKMMESERNCYYYKDSLYVKLLFYPTTDGVGFRMDPIDYLYEIFEKNNDTLAGCFIHDGHYCFAYGDVVTTLFTVTGETMLFSYKIPVVNERKGVTTISIIDDSRSMQFYEYKNGELRLVEYCPCEDNRDKKERINNPFEIKPLKQVPPKLILNLSMPR